MIFQSTLTQSQKNLLRSVVKGEKSRVKELLKQKSDGLCPRGVSRILWHAVRLGTLDMASLLVESGADVNLTDPFDNFGSSLLHELIVKGDSRCEKLAISMIDHGADVNACDREDKSVLHLAIITARSIALIKKLFEQGAWVRSVFDHHRDVAPIDGNPMSDCRRAANALHCFTESGGTQYLEGAKWFLDMKFPIKHMENGGLTLHCAIKASRSQLVELLISYGFDVNRPAINGILPLYEASKLKKSTISELLIRSGAEVNARSSGPNIFGGTALHAACKIGSAANIEVLLRHGADINLTDSRGRTPFSLIDISKRTNEARRIIMRQMAVLVSEGKSINRKDLKTIRLHYEMRAYCNLCLGELGMMKTYEVINKIPLFTFFRKKDVKELLFVTRNYDFVENFSAEHWKDQFPIFHDELDLSFRKVKIQKKFLRDREEALYDSLENTLPHVPLEKIVYYLYFSNI